AGHVTAGAAYGGEHEAISVVGALDAAGELGWDAVLAGPGPGILGSDTRYGHGGVAALDTAHPAPSVGRSTHLPRPGRRRRPPHRGPSHPPAGVLGLGRGDVRVPGPGVATGEWPTGGADAGAGAPLDELREACEDRHDMLVQPVDLAGYAESGLPV